MTEIARPPLPPFDTATAAHKARRAEGAGNARDPNRVALADIQPSLWRNRAAFFRGREAIREFLIRKRARALDHRLIKEAWACIANRIVMRSNHEWHDDSGRWFHSHGNEQPAFDAPGPMRRREASINDLPIAASDRRFLWHPWGPRPEDHPGLTEPGP